MSIRVSHSTPVPLPAGRHGLERIRHKFFSSRSHSPAGDIIIKTTPTDPPSLEFTPRAASSSSKHISDAPLNSVSDDPHRILAHRSLCASPEEEDSRPPTPSTSYEIKTARRKQCIIDASVVQSALLPSPSFGNFNVAYSPGVTRSFSQRDQRDEYRRQALHSSLKRMNSAPITRYTPPLTPSPRPILQEKTNEAPPTKSRSTSRKQQGSIPTVCILAIDPEWDPSQGDATVYVFPQDDEELEGRDMVTPDEILKGFFPECINGSELDIC